MFLETSTQNLRRRVAIVGVVLIVTPMIAICMAGLAILHRLQQAPIVETVKPSGNVDLTRLARELVDECRAYREASIEALKSGARILQGIGPIHLDGNRKAIWHAKNELTGQPKAFEVPVMTVGGESFFSVESFDKPVPGVDQITKATGTEATIFQRLNERGDMLRVASSMKTENGSRRIGTFLPADGLTGDSAQILQEILSGKTHIGKEVEGKVSYLTAYQPLRNGLGNIVGILKTVLPEEQIRTKVRELVATSGRQSGDRPEIFILEAAGERRGTAILMGDESLQGANLWNQKDRAGRPYVQEMCSRATQLPNGEWADYEYQQATRAGGIPRSMTARFTFVPELNWVVGLAQPEQHSLAGMPFAQLIVWGMWLLFGVSVASTGFAIRIWIEFSRDFAIKLTALLDHVRKDAKQLSEVAVELSHDAVHALKEKTAPVAARVEIVDTPQIRTSEVVLEKRVMTEEVRSALSHIDASNQSLIRLLKAIDQITYSTNLLTVNAAEEAATSPNGGQNIADLADHFRSLAARCREAAKTAQTEIEQSRANLQKTRLESSNNAAESQSDDIAAGLRRQSEALLRLAAGLDQTVQSVEADIGIHSTTRS